MLKIYKEELLLIKYYGEKHLMMDIGANLLHWFISFLIRNLLTLTLLIQNEKRNVCSSFKNITWVVDLTNMQLTSKFNKVFRFYYVLLIFVGNMRWLLLWKTKKIL